jgi:glutaredoxin
VSTVTVFTHADCHLCEEALDVLRGLQAEHPFELRELDIRADDALHMAYFERVPVIVLDGEELCEFVVDEPLLRARLAQMARAQRVRPHPS